MNFSLPKSLEILERTPNVLKAMLSGINEAWTDKNEGEGTWSVKEVVAHLIVCEETNWIVRANIILSGNTNLTFVPINMTAHFELSREHSLNALMEEFTRIRTENIKTLINLNITEQDFTTTAIHPKLGEINLQQLIATWVTHDLSHLNQITRVMAKQYKQDVGPFIQFLRILNA